jgi:hypothetical protein
MGACAYFGADSTTLKKTLALPLPTGKVATQECFQKLDWWLLVAPKYKYKKHLR